LVAVLDDGTVWVAGRRPTVDFLEALTPSPEPEPIRRVEPFHPGRNTRLIRLYDGMVCMEGPDYPGGLLCDRRTFPFEFVPGAASETDRYQDSTAICRRYSMEDGYEEISCLSEDLTFRFVRRWTNRP
jgi:hypothetical protein